MMRSHDVTQLTTAELERAKRDLQANLGLITPHSAAQVPITAQMQAIDAELAERAGSQEADRDRAVATDTEPADCDPLAALASEYEEEWKIWKPGRYLADHRRLDVSLKSDSVVGLAEKLRAFTELVKDLP
jgi:hypothetical protein